MTDDVNLTSTAGAIRFSLSRQEGIVRRVTLDEDVALAIADLIERWPAAEAVIQAARAFYDAPCGTTPAVEGTPCGDLVLAIGDALAALGDGQ